MKEGIRKTGGNKPSREELTKEKSLIQRKLGGYPEEIANVKD